MVVDVREKGQRRAQRNVVMARDKPVQTHPHSSTPPNKHKHVHIHDVRVNSALAIDYNPLVASMASQVLPLGSLIYPYFLSQHQT